MATLDVLLIERMGEVKLLLVVCCFPWCRQCQFHHVVNHLERCMSAGVVVYDSCILDVNICKATEHCGLAIQSECFY